LPPKRSPEGSRSNPRGINPGGLRNRAECGYCRGSAGRSTRDGDKFCPAAESWPVRRYRARLGIPQRVPPPRIGNPLNWSTVMPCLGSNPVPWDGAVVGATSPERLAAHAGRSPVITTNTSHRTVRRGDSIAISFQAGTGSSTAWLLEATYPRQRQPDRSGSYWRTGVAPPAGILMCGTSVRSVMRDPLRMPGFGRQSPPRGDRPTPRDVPSKAILAAVDDGVTSSDSQPRWRTPTGRSP